MEVFYEAKKVPVHPNLIFSTFQAARECDRGDIVLGFCEACGFICNLAFDTSLMKYSPLYEASHGFSSQFRSYLENLAVYLISRYNLHGKEIIEIGCGKGEFLTMLCELGDNKGTGFDPGYVNEGSTASRERVEFIRDFYSERYGNYKSDLVCCRHVLEHIHQPAEFIKDLRRSIGDRATTVVFLEVPNVSWILSNLTFWDIFYEHCSYFSPSSLAGLFERCGFNVVRVTEAFAGQYVCLEAFPKGEGGEDEFADVKKPQEVAHAVGHFATHWQDKMENVRSQFDGMRQSGKRCVIWGAAGRCVTILNALDISLKFIEYVVDINPRKQWMYVPGTGQQIVPPDFLKTYGPDAILIMNPYYFDEIRGTVASMGISVELILL